MADFKTVGWTRPLGAGVENEIAKTLPFWKEKMAKGGMRFACPHKKVKDVIGNGTQEFVNALERKLIDRNKGQTEDNYVSVMKKYVIHGKEIVQKFNVFICSECGQEVHVPEIASYDEYVGSMKYIFKALLDMLPSEMYFRSSFESNQIPSGNLLLAMLMSTSTDIARFSRQQFGEFISDFSDRYYKLDEELKKGGAIAAGEINPADFGSLAQIQVADPLMYGAVYSQYKPTEVRDSFMGELGGQQVNNAAPVAPAQQGNKGAGGVKIAN